MNNLENNARFRTLKTIMGLTDEDIQAHHNVNPREISRWSGSNPRYPTPDFAMEWIENLWDTYLNAIEEALAIPGPVQLRTYLTEASVRADHPQLTKRMHDHLNGLIQAQADLADRETVFSFVDPRQ